MALINVRTTVEDDLPAIFELGRTMRAESVIPFPEIDENAARDTLALLDDFYFIAVAEVANTDPAPRKTGNEIIGMFTAQLNRYAFSQEFFAQHDIFYVHPDWRGTRAALLLVKAFESWAQECGLTRALLSVHSGLFPERTGRFYKKLGYRPMGGNFMKELD